MPESMRTPESEIGGTGGVSASPTPASAGAWVGVPGDGVCGAPGGGVGAPGCDGPVGDGGVDGVPGDGVPGVGDGAPGDGVGGFGAGAPGVGGAPVGPDGCDASSTAGPPGPPMPRSSTACGPPGGGAYEPVPASGIALPSLLAGGTGGAGSPLGVVASGRGVAGASLR